MSSNHQVIVDLMPYYNNAGIAASCDQGADGLDGLGTILCTECLPASKATITCQRIPFVFPDKRDGSNDNIACEAQEIPLPMGHYCALHFLGMSDWRAFEEPLQLKAPDGTCTETSLGLSDASHYQGLQYGEREAIECQLITPDSLIPHVFLFGISLPSAGYQMKETHIEGGIWHQVIPMEESRLLSSIVLPDNPSMHLFALTLCGNRRDTCEKAD